MATYSSDYLQVGMAYLVEVIQQLSMARRVEDIVEIVRHAARELTGADGASFVLRDEDRCHYVDEDAIGPLWKGKRFPMSACISGWAMLNRQVAAIEDIYQDPRIPIDAYRPTFVKGLVMVPIRERAPIGAIGNYWATSHRASPEEIRLLRALADSTSTALENVQLISSLEAAKASLENSLRSRDEFLSVASHELRTPLGALKLQLQMTERQIDRHGPAGVPPETLKRYVDLSLRQTNHLTTLVERLLDISRIQLDQLHLDYARVNFAEVVRRSVDQMMPSLSQAECRTDLELAEGIEGEWDAHRIEEIVMNLVSNVCKYAPGQPVKIRAANDGHGSAVLTVEDHGGGIPVDMQTRIFDRFERGVTSQHVSGLGLGLFITKNLVEAHGGSIRVASPTGTGAVFTVELPLAPPPREATL